MCIITKEFEKRVAIGLPARRGKTFEGGKIFKEEEMKI